MKSRCILFLSLFLQKISLFPQMRSCDYLLLLPQMYPHIYLFYIYLSISVNVFIYIIRIFFSQRCIILLCLLIFHLIIYLYFLFYICRYFHISIYEATMSVKIVFLQLIIFNSYKLFHCIVCYKYLINVLMFVLIFQYICDDLAFEHL